MVEKYHCACSILYDNDNIVVDAGDKAEAIMKARNIVKNDAKDIEELIRCECYTEKELESMDWW
jgi:hypothetical protein